MNPNQTNLPSSNKSSESNNPNPPTDATPTIDVGGIYPESTPYVPPAAAGTINQPANDILPTVSDSHSSNNVSHPPRKKGLIPSWMKEGFTGFILFLVIPCLAIAVIIASFGFQSYIVDGQSMEVTLQNHDRLLVDKLPRTISHLTHHAYVPKRGDIIIFNQSGLFNSSSTKQKQLIKRVIGLPGDNVVISNGSITIFNKTHPGGFNPDKSGKYVISAAQTPGDINLTLAANEIFVCGDNRLNSEDSRYFGPVSVDHIVGKLSLRILPINKARHF